MMMKSLKSMLMGGAILFGLAMCFTSCEGSLDDVFGEWSRPVPSTVVEDARVLGAAEAKGAIVSVTYTVGSKTYTAKFEKGDGDNYTLISNTKVSGARAMTRTEDADVVPTDVSDANAPKLNLVSGKLQLIVLNSAGAPLFEATMNIEGGEVVVTNTNFKGIDCTIGDMYINDKVAEIKNPELKAVKLYAPAANLTYSIKYSKENNETWADVITRYSTLGIAEIKTENNQITMKFTKDFIKNALIELGRNAEATATTISTKTFYLVSNNPVNNARAFTRAYSYTPNYVKPEDKVGVVGTNDQTTYYLYLPSAPTN